MNFYSINLIWDLLISKKTQTFSEIKKKLQHLIHLVYLLVYPWIYCWTAILNAMEIILT